jgi:hypothetical protein
MIAGTKCTFRVQLYKMYKWQKSAILPVQNVHTVLRQCTFVPMAAGRDLYGLKLRQTNRQEHQMKTETENSQSWPADKIERRSVESLIPYARNARTHSDAQVAQIAASIKEWGWTTPVLVDEDGEIIAGHGRVMAARKLGIEEVPTMTATGWTKAQKQAYVLADNQLPQNAGWDMDLLKIEMQDLDGEGFDLELLGFSVEFMDGLFYEPKYEPGTEGDQGKLDELAPKMVECPHCGGNFDLRENGQG